MPFELLLIEDDLEISELLSTFLSKEGFSIHCALDGLEGERQALSQHFDIIILDIMLPEKDGLSVLRDLRGKIDTPILMLTAKGEEVDRIIGFEVGADDYLPKPFNPRELLARIRALLRRVDIDRNRRNSEISELASESITLKLKTREALIDQQVTELTSTEFNILLAMMSSPNEIISKEALTQQVLGRKLTLYDRAIDMHMSNLRKKLNHDQIKTVRGSGYLFCGTVEQK